MQRKILGFLLLCLLLCFPAYASISVDDFLTSDDVSVIHLQDFKNTVVDAINNFDGGNVEDGSITDEKLDDDASQHNRWNEAFNDFIYTGLTIPTSLTLASTTVSGIGYVNGVRVVKDATAHTYTASKWTFVDLSDTGVFTYQETSIGASEPSTTANSIRLARVSTDTTTVLSVRDDRVTTINLAVGSAITTITDADNDTYVRTSQSADEDILRFGLGNTTLSSAREVLTLQATGTNNEKLEPTTNNEVDIGSSSKKFRNVWVANAVTADTAVLTNATITSARITTINTGTNNQGDIFYDNGTTSLTRLTPGTSGSFLLTNGAAANPSWGGTGAGVYSFSAYAAGSQDVASSTGPTQVVFDTEDFDTSGNFASNTFTAPVTGKYLFTANIIFVSSTTNTTANFNITKNGSQWAPIANCQSNAAGQEIMCSGSIIMSLTATNTVDIQYSNNNATGTKSISGGVSKTRFTGAKLL